MTQQQSLLESVVAFISARLEAHASAPHPAGQHQATAPLFVGVQGPQGKYAALCESKDHLPSPPSLGIGKTTLAGQIVAHFLAQGIAAIHVSMDDFYYSPARGDGSEEGQGAGESTQATACTSSNWLLAGRGNPGTHDLVLAKRTLASLKQANSLHTPTSTLTLSLPHFDKSLRQGRGDRVSRAVSVPFPLRLVLIEGWTLGFSSLEDLDLLHVYEEHPDLSRTCAFSDLAHLNGLLKGYAFIDQMVDLWIGLEAEDLSSVYPWRLEQERCLQAAKRAKTMSEDEVRALVDRCMPTYALYYRDWIQALRKAPDRALVVRVGRGRELL